MGQLGVPGGLITRRSVVQIHTPLPRGFWCGNVLILITIERENMCSHGEVIFLS